MGVASPAREKVEEGQYWTDGVRLVYVVRVLNKGVYVEDALDPDGVVGLTMFELASWRKVVPDGPV